MIEFQVYNDFKEILEKQLLPISIGKAQKHDLVRTKLVELIKQNNIINNNSIKLDYSFDTSTIEDRAEMLNNVNKELFQDKPIQPLSSSGVQPYGGGEYSLL